MRLTELWFTERMNPNERTRDERRAAPNAPTTRCPVSLAPGFSRVRWRGKMVQPLQRLPAPGKPLKRFASQISAARARKPQPQRGCVLQPRVARAKRATLGGREQIAFNPNGVAAQCATVTNDAAPLGLARGLVSSPPISSRLGSSRVRYPSESPPRTAINFSNKSSSAPTPT